MKPKHTIISHPPRESGDLRAFARALIAVALRLAEEQQAQKAMVQSDQPKRAA